MIVPSFSAKGGIATVVSGYRNSDLEKQFQMKYIETYCDRNKLRKILKAIGAYFAFLKEVWFHKPDLLHVHSSFGGSFYRKLPFIRLASRHKIPIINHIHGSEIAEFYTNAGKRKQRLVEKCFDQCACLVVLSQEWQEKLAVVKTDTPKVVVENYSAIHKECLRVKNETPKTVLFLGFITKLKGCFDLPAVAAEVTKEYGDIRFIIAGSGDAETLQSRLKTQGLLQYFQFPGWVRNDEKDALLKSADLFFLPSYTEGMPMSILEAMGYGLPIVASNVGGIPQLVEENVNGFMADPGDIEAFSNAILAIVKDRDFAFKMGQKSLQKAEESYSLKSHLEKLSTLYLRVLSKEN